ncbi:MAG: hypothetical protein AAF297_08265 [Planctomycetota bacterium]
MSRAKLIVLGVVAVVLLGGGYLIADAVYLSPASERRDEIAGLRDQNERFYNALLGGARAEDAWRSMTETMIASSDQDAAHRVRTLTLAIGDDAGLSDVVVTHGRPSAPANPASDRRSKLSKSVRDAVSEREDFRVLRGTLRGTGTLEQLSLASATLAAQPWAHRVEQLNVEPGDRDRRTYDLTLSFATMYALDVRRDAAPAVVPPDPARLEALLALARANPFVAPPAPAPVVVPPVVTAAEVVRPKPAPPPPPPFNQWKVTGVVERRSGVEVDGVELFLRRQDTGETRVLPPGEAVLGLTFERAEPMSVLFREGDRLVRVAVGRTLADRTPIED